MAQRKKSPEYWTVDDIAAHCDLKLTSVPRQLHRWGIHPIAREPGRSGKNMYDADEVRQAQKGRPGSGYHSEARKRNAAKTSPKTE